MQQNDYKKQFNPERVIQPKGDDDNLGDQRLNPVYVLTEDIILAVNVAMVTNRPLLVRGPSGTGKSTLARCVAHSLNSPYYEEVITSDTQANDLMWKIDYLNRLHDAQSGIKEKAMDIGEYIIPGPLWWAFEPDTAHTQDKKARTQQQSDNNEAEATGKTDKTDKTGRPVVLIDEIDKANPDVPNNLLVAMGSLFFNVKELNQDVSAKADNAPLIFITTNEERDLPLPFLRRCLEIKIEYPSIARMNEIAAAHFCDPETITNLNEVISFIVDFIAPKNREKNIEASPAEVLDALTAYQKLGITLGSEDWELMLTNIGFMKKRA